MRNGLDFSFGNGLTTAQLQAGQVSFVGRYLSGGNSKDIVKAELDNYLAAKIGVIFFWETDGTMTSESEGTLHAHAANNQLNSIGADGAVVFFTADEQTPADLTGYMKGAASVLGSDRMGLYGGLATVQAGFNQGLCKYAVQTYAWSGTPTVWDDRALVRQYRNGVKFGPATVDLEQAAFWGKSQILTMSDDFGQYPKPAAPPADGPVRHVIPAGNRLSLTRWTETTRHETVADLVAFNKTLSGNKLDPTNFALLEALAAADADAENSAAKAVRPAMGSGTVIYTKN